MLSPLKTHTLDIDFDGELSWEEYIRTGAPGTPDDYPIWRVKEEQTRLMPQSGKRRVILATFGQSAISCEIDTWALGESLDVLFSHENLWIARQYPLLPNALDKYTLGLASLRPFDFEEDGEKKRRTVTVWWYSDKDKNLYRMAHLTNPLGSWSKDYWFSFTPIL